MGRWSQSSTAGERNAQPAARLGYRFGRRVAGVVLTLAAGVAALGSLALASDAARRPGVMRARLAAGTQLLDIGGPANVQAVSPGFLGLSLEYGAVEPYAGWDPSQLNPVFLQLVRNLTPNQAPVIRIGGDSTDWTWWPVAGMEQPHGVSYSLSPSWAAVTGGLTEALHARLILGLNLEARSRRLLATEAYGLTQSLPQGSIEAFEPGNEPELYGSWTYYRTPSGQKVTGRPASYWLDGFEHDVANIAGALGDFPLAGPATGAVTWMRALPSIVAAEPRIRLVTIHRYPLQLCYIPRSSPRYPTLAHLLSAKSSRGLAAILPSLVSTSHGHGLTLRIDEMNTIGCGKDRRVADTFASALWAVDALAAMAAAGADGVNIHTYPGAPYELFRFAHRAGTWVAAVQPEYYGLLMFAAAEPPGSQSLNLFGPGTRALSAWATRGPDGKVRVLLVNEGRRARVIGIKVRGTSGDASIARLLAPAPTSSSRISFAGQSFGAHTTTGTLTGAPSQSTVRLTRGVFPVAVPATSAALITVSAR